jgi:hypothetical protein
MALRRGLKHFVAIIRHHSFRLEQLPLSFAIALARDPPQPQLPRQPRIPTSNIEDRLAQVGEASPSAVAGLPHITHFAGWGRTLLQRANL